MKNRLSFKSAMLQLLINGLALGISIWLVDSVSLNSPIGMFSGAALISVLQVLSTRLFNIVAKVLGVYGILLISLIGNAILVWLAFWILPSIFVDSFWGGLITAWVYALIVTFLQWILLSQSDEVYLNLLMRGIKFKPTKSNKPAFLYVQLDGVSAPVLDWQLKAGNLPNIARLLQSSGYVFDSWQTQIPSTTPASQAGILFGDNSTIPAFRWFEKETGQLVVANQTNGAELIESRSSNGNGLLADGGVSIGNLFSGDAVENIMVMSKLSGDRQSIKSIRNYSNYFYSSTGFIRSVVLTVGEMIKEIYQAKRQVSLDMKPRIKRHGSYIALRAATNVLLRDLQTSIVVQNMMKGANSIYVDYLDYDEVAHHAGPARAESLASLAGIDRIIGILDKARNLAPRDYYLILVSDHGQSQGATFSQIHHGKSLEDFVQEYIGKSQLVNSNTNPVEQNTQTSLLKKSSTNTTVDLDSDVIITGSGNLGNIWFKKIKNKVFMEEINSKYPNLIDKLLDTKGIGLILVKSKKGELCIGKEGTINLSSGQITNKNPLDYYETDFFEALKKLRATTNSPDICVISSYDKASGEVHAFEELVGNHGGIGGWQTEAVLIHHQSLEISTKFMKQGKIRDSVDLHKQLKEWQKI